MAPDAPRNEQYTVSVTADEGKAMDLLARWRAEAKAGAGAEERFLAEMDAMADLELAALAMSFLKAGDTCYELYSSLTAHLWMERGVLYQPVEARLERGPSDLDRIIDLLTPRHGRDGSANEP